MFSDDALKSASDLTLDLAMADVDLPVITVTEDGSGSTGILLSTLWSQSGVLPVGYNHTITHNEFTPLDPATSIHSVTGCTNTAAGQIIHCFIENGQLDLSLTLADDEAYISNYNNSLPISVKADGSTPGTISFAAVNACLANYSVDSAECAAALLYACGVVQKANYSSDATSTAWKTDLFYRAGLKSANQIYMNSKSTTYYWGTTDADGNVTISDAGYEVLIENLRAGRPVGTSIPCHAVVIDGYDAENDLFHINYGWGSRSLSTRWYSREEMREEGHYHFVYDLFTEYVETFTVTDGRVYGTGTMVRAFEQARSMKGSNTVVFADAVAGKAVKILQNIVLSDDITVRDFNMTVTGDNIYQGFYAESSAGNIVFENFGGELIVNSSRSYNYCMDLYQADALSFSADHALLYAGSYSVGGDYSAGAAAVLDAMRGARDNAARLADFVISAASSAYSFYGTDGDDMIVLGGRSLVVGGVYLRGGHDTISVTGGSQLYGDISGSGSKTITVDSSSAVTGLIYTRSNIRFVLDSAAADHALFTIERNVYNVYSNATVTVDITDAEVGTYTLFAAAAGASYADYLNRINVTVTGTGISDYTLVGNGTTSGNCADLVCESGALKLKVTSAVGVSAPKVLSVAADITAATNRDVTVTAVFNGNSVKKEYSLDNSTWKTYTSGVTVSANGTVYFRGIGANGVVSQVASYEVANIDRTAPDKPTARANTALPTYDKVTVAAFFGSGTVTKQYSRDNQTWREYTGGVVMTENGTVYFRGIDAVGNISEVSSHTVANIDRMPVRVLSNGVTISSGNVISDKTISFSGADTMLVYSGGVARKTTVNSGGMISVLSDGTASATTVNSGGSLHVSNGGTASATTLNSGGRLYVFSGGAASTTTLNSGGALYVSNGGVASTTTVNSGSIVVYTNGTANSTTVNSGGWMYVYSGGEVTSTTVNSGYITVSSGGKATSTALNSGGRLYVYSDGTASATTIDSGGYGYVSSGATAVSAVVERGGYMAISSGASASAIKENGGFVSVADGAAATFTANRIGNLILSNASATLHSGTVAEAAVLNSGGRLYVYSGAAASTTTVNAGGALYVSNGGAASTTTVNSGSIVVYTNGTANSTTLNSGGRLYVYSGAAASTTTVNAGYIVVYTNGTANSTTLNSGGRLYVDSGAAASSTSINSGGSMYVSSGGTVTGETTLAGGAYLYFNNTGVLDFDLAGRSSDASALLNDLSLVRGTPTLTVTVSESQKSGRYRLAGGVAASFDKTITVNTPAGNTLGTVSVAGGLAVGDLALVLTVADGTLVLEIENSYKPRVIPVTADITTPTNGNVVVTAAFGAAVTKKEYSLDNRTWLTYTTGVVMTANGKVYFRGADAAGNISEEAVCTVSNIDRVAPDKPTATADITIPTNGNVVVTAAYSADTVGREYSLDNATWKAYTSGVVMSSNGTVCFRGIDEAGNVSEVASYAVANIDRIPPAKPTATADLTAVTNRDVVVTAAYSADTVGREYSLDNAAWREYTSGVVMSSNGTVWFRGIDEAGNVSEVASFAVTNIDKTAPVITLTGDNSTPAHQTELAATVDDGSVLYYRVDGGAWLAYASPITVGANAVYEFAATDAAGNTGSAAMEFLNILTEFPEKLSATADRQKWSTTGAERYIIEYSTDNFEHVIGMETSGNGIDTLGLPAGTYSWRVRSAENDRWVQGENIVSADADPVPRVVGSDENGDTDVFFAVPTGIWGGKYAAQHLGSVGDWGGTNELVSLAGKGRIGSFFFGSSDANVLLLTDDADGDALFVDDIFTELPDEVAENRSRLARIDEIRAGAGADIVDLTSRRFAYAGDGLTVRGGSGDDVIWANKGDNTLFGDSGDDRLVGASGNDVLVGGIGNDSMHGGGGDDLFAFCENWGADTVEQLAGGGVTLWFASGNSSKWNAALLTYADGENSVTVKGVAADKVTLKFGDDGTDLYAALADAGAFAGATSEKIFEDRNKGILA